MEDRKILRNRGIPELTGSFSAVNFLNFALYKPGTRNAERTTNGGSHWNCLWGQIGRTAKRYQLDYLDERLYHVYRNEGASLRDLETIVNERILASEFQAADIETYGDSSDLYRRLTTDDVSAGKRAESRSCFRQAGVDITQLESGFVTNQTVRKHVCESLGININGDMDFTIPDARTRIDRLQSRREVVVGEKLDHVRWTSTIETGDLDVVLTMRVSCEVCGDLYRLAGRLDQGHCQCRGGPSNEHDEPIQ